jgi:hypothetical protein
MFFTVVCAGARLKKSANGEESKENFQDGATGIVLMRRFDVASDDMRSRNFEECYLCLYRNIRQKGKESSRVDAEPSIVVVRDENETGYSVP